MSLVLSFDAQGQPQITSLVADAHARGLVVHPYTWRADSLPRNAQSFDDLLDVAFAVAGVDGIFTDQADLAVAFVSAMR
jgi:glycerophosphoryl diester phosphodiesterase